jgi:hypothetical protein
VRKVPVAAAANLFLKRLDSPELSNATHKVLGLIAGAKVAGEKRKLIFYGGIALAIGAAAAAVAQTDAYKTWIAAVVAAGSLAGAAGAWLRKLDAFAQSGKEFEAEQEQIKRAIIDEVTSAHESIVSGLRTAAANQITVFNTLGAQLKELEDVPVTARLAIEALEEERASALAQYAAAAAVVEKKKTELSRLTTGTLLEEFLDDRLSTDGYLKELTIFSRIRNDFERLSELMTKSYEDYVAEKVVEPPAVSRIVLYIDDLDRCPADRVVEVLKLVHLLLAFPLFVCVVAVDPRWITWCLQEAPGLIGPKGESELAAEFGDRANASDYLEKIFQIPLWLRPVPSEYRAAIARTLLDPAESEAEPWVDMPIVASRDTVVTSAAKHEGPEGDGQGPTIDPDMITREELSYLDELAGLLGGNPRSLKRFVNTYRLVKTALSDVELASFLQPSTVDGAWARNRTNAYLPYRICMAQLAVLCTQRNRALRLVRHADTATGNTSLTEWLGQFKTIDADLAERFQAALSKDLEGANVDTFKRWLERTRRYSFYL